MERLIQLFDDLDDLLAPSVAILTRVHWLRGLAVLTLMLVLTEGVGVSWPLAFMLALPVPPLADLAHARLRRAGVPQLSARLSLGSRY
jgi:hypothetical protein